jgi:hypothetical protein
MTEQKEKAGLFPPILYKYISWEKEHHREILKENKIYFCSPSKFNDPFDCKIPYRFDKRTDAEWRLVFRQHLKRDYPLWEDWKINKFIKDVDKEKNYRKEEVLASERELENKYANSHGIFCLSSNPLNILMWSHYADGHKGICIGFDYSLLDASFKVFADNNQKYIPLIYKVKYPDKYPILIPPPDIQDISYMNEKFINKARDWEYEQEYRCILYPRDTSFRASNTKIKLNKEIICDVILGCKILEKHKNEILDYLKKSNNSVNISQAKIRNERFELDLI